MKMSVKELEGRFTTLNDMNGFTQGFLENPLHQLSEEKDWETFMDVVALTILGILFFPKAENFVDYPTINGFATFKIWSENPTTTILVDEYVALDSCHSKKESV